MVSKMRTGAVALIECRARFIQAVVEGVQRGRQPWRVLQKAGTPSIACRGGCTLSALLCHYLSRPARPPQICRALRTSLVCSAATPPHPPCQGLAVPRPPDPRLGPLPHHGGHGTSPARSVSLPPFTATCLDPGRCTTPLCSYTAPDTAKEAGQGGHTRTVRVPVLALARAMHADHPFRRALVRAQILRATSASSPIPPTYPLIARYGMGRGGTRRHINPR